MATPIVGCCKQSLISQCTGSVGYFLQFSAHSKRRRRCYLCECTGNKQRRSKNTSLIIKEDFSRKLATARELHVCCEIDEYSSSEQLEVHNTRGAELVSQKKIQTRDTEEV